MGKLYLAPGAPPSSSRYSYWATQLTLWFATLSWLAIYVLALALENFNLASVQDNPLVGPGRSGLSLVG